MIRRYGYPFEKQNADPDPIWIRYCGYPFVTHRSQVIIRIADNATGHGSRIGRGSRGGGYETSNAVSGEFGRNLAIEDQIWRSLSILIDLISM